MRACRSPRGSPADVAALRADYVPANLVAQHVSPPLSEDAYITLKVSDNLHAALMPYMWAVYKAQAKSRLSQVRIRAREPAAASRPASTRARRRRKTARAAAPSSRPTSWCAISRGFARSRGIRSSIAGCRSWASTGRSSASSAVRPHAVRCTPRPAPTAARTTSTTAESWRRASPGYITTRGGRHVAFAFYIGAMQGPKDEDTGSVAGQILGGMAAATYLNL